MTLFPFFDISFSPPLLFVTFPFSPCFPPSLPLIDL